MNMNTEFHRGRPQNIFGSSYALRCNLGIQQRRLLLYQYRAEF